MEKQIEIRIKIGRLAGLLKLLKPCISTDKTRYYINGVNVEHKDRKSQNHRRTVAVTPAIVSLTVAATHYQMVIVVTIRFPDMNAPENVQLQWMNY